MTEGELLNEDKDELVEAYRLASRDNPLLFIRGLTIPSQDGPQLFDGCIQPFQVECFEALVPSLVAVRDGNLPPIRRHWWERTKKAAKDADLAAAALWVIAFANRPFYAQVGAADSDQAAIVKRRINDLLFYNPWVAELVEIQRSLVKQKIGLGTMEVLAADISGSHGENPDLLIINELSHIRRWEFVENLMDNADGVKRGMAIIATNAGFKGTKAETWRKNAIAEDIWFTNILKEPAPWTSKESLADAKKRNTPSRFNRLWKGKWVSGKGDALDENDIDRCFSFGIGPLTAPEPGWVYLGSLDLGVTHDHSGLVVLGVDTEAGRIRLAWMKSWKPGKDEEVNLQDVENECIRVNKVFRLVGLFYDPTEARLMAQRLTRRGVPTREMSFSSPKNLTAMATALMQVVESHILECWDDDEGTLRRDFGKFNVVERNNGYKLEAVSDEYGHADVGTALVIGLPKAVELLAGIMRLQGDDDLSSPEGDLTEEEVKSMPDELREIYEMGDDQKRSTRSIFGDEEDDEEE